MAPPVGRAPTNRSIDRAFSPTPRVRRIDPRLVRDHVREFVCLSRAFARRLDRSPLRRPSLPRLRRRRRRILPRFPGRSGRRPSSPARRFGKAPLRKCRCASSRPSHPRVASPRRRVASRRVAISRHPSQPSPARGGRAVDGSKWMIKKNPRVSVGHDSSTRTQSSSRTRHRRLRARWRKNSPIIHPSVRRRRDASRRASSSSRARRDASRDATRRVGPDGGSAARGGARRRRRRRSGPSGRVAVRARARAYDRAVARASLEEWRPSPMPHARRLATASVP